MNERIQKLLARTGTGSRRQVEKWITEGRLTINGQVATLGARISYTDTVCLDHRAIALIDSQYQVTRVLLYHKPAGKICTRHDPEGRPTIFETLPTLRHGRWICIGRLDFNTSGLLLLTNHGPLANQLMHPRANIEREYAVRVRGMVTPTMLHNLQTGVQLADGWAHFQKLVAAGSQGTNHWYHIIVTEGRNRLVRRLWESQGVTVSRLIRIRFGNIHLPRYLCRNRYIELKREEIPFSNTQSS